MSYMPTSTDPAVAVQASDVVPDLVLGSGVRTGLGPAARTVCAVWATCLLLAISYPQALAAWLDDFEPNPIVEVARNCVDRLAQVSEGLGIARFSGTVRDIGRTIARKPN